MGSSKYCMHCALFFVGVMALKGTQAQPATLAELADFDTSVGFSTPRQVTVLQSFDRTKNIFYLLPSTVDFVLPEFGAGALGLQASTKLHSKGATSSLTFSVKPQAMNREMSQAIEELTRRFPRAQFVFPVPVKSQLSLSTIERPASSVLLENEATALTNTNAFTIRLSPLEARVLLLPQSTESPSASFQYAYTIRGVSRNPEGNVTVQDRTFRLGGVLRGFCAPFPATTLNHQTGQSGCSFVRFDARLVREIQTLLKSSQDYDGKVDGKFGPRTDNAIRRFQKRETLFVTGYPSQELLEVIREKIGSGA